MYLQQYTNNRGDDMSEVSDLIASLTQELRRGTIIVGVLSQLSEPQYGYSLVSILEEKGLQVESNTLYPLLRRLEKQKLLKSVWDTKESRPRKYYVLTEMGTEIFARLCIEWRNMADSLDKLLDEYENNRS